MADKFKFRLDLLFSYWILVWYLLYVFKAVSVAPKLTIIMAIIVNILTVCYMIYFNVYPPWKIVLFITVISLMKGIPLWTLRKNQIQFGKELIFTSILLMLYVIWLYINKTNIYDIQKIHPAMASIAYLVGLVSK